MIDYFYSKSELLSRWRRGPLGPHLDHFATLLIEQGFSKSTGRKKLRLLAHLGQWLKAKRIPLKNLDEEQVSDFQADRRKRHQAEDGDETTLAMLLQFLRQEGVVPAVVDRSIRDPVDLLMQDYTASCSMKRTDIHYIVRLRSDH
jgi:hypothetical protein